MEFPGPDSLPFLKTHLQGSRNLSGGVQVAGLLGTFGVKSAERTPELQCPGSPGKVLAFPFLTCQWKVTTGGSQDFRMLSRNALGVSSFLSPFTSRV